MIWEEPRQTPAVPWDLGLTSYHIWILLKLVGNHEILSLQSSGVNWNQRGITHSIVPLITPGSCLPPAASCPHQPQGTAATSSCHPAGWLAERAATPDSLEPITNACERGKGLVQEGRELVTSPYITPSHSVTSWCWELVMLGDLWQVCFAQGRALVGENRQALVEILGDWQGFLAMVCQDALYATEVHIALDE